MKRLLMIILCVLLLVATAVPALAAGTVSLAANKTSVYRDGEFTVTVGVSGWGACSKGGVEVSFGSSFELISGEWLVKSALMQDFSVSSRDGVFACGEAQDITGNLIRLTFKVKANAAFAYDKIKIKVSLGGVDTVKEIDILVACSHNFSAWTDDGVTGHSRKCSICGRNETGAHGYDSNCDTTCNSCGSVREITHDFTGKWEGDETGHWHSCKVCGEKDEVVEHVPGKEADEYSDQVCLNCDYVLVPALGHTHKYDDKYNTGEKGHWQTCTGCGESAEMLEHEYENDCDTNCNVCDYQRRVTHVAGSWEHDEAGHWKPCGICQEPQEQGAHTWDAGYVKTAPTDTEEGLRVYRCSVCMAERSEVIPLISIAAPIAGWPWWLWLVSGVGAGIVLSTAVWTIVIFSVKGKRKGRFS